MESMKIGNKYRILRDGRHLPEEISQKEMNDILSNLKGSLQNICSLLEETNNRCDVASDIVSDLMNSACLSYDDGKEWHLRCLIHEIEEMQEQLRSSSAEIPSYKEAETIFDHGYSEEWHNSGVYSKTIEDSNEKEVVEEIIFKHKKPIYRKRTTIWEIVPGGKHSKEINYEDLPIDKNMKRLINNTKRYFGNIK